MAKTFGLIALLLIAATTLRSQSRCEDPSQPGTASVSAASAVEPKRWLERLLRYVDFSAQHRLAGLASYYSNSLDGTLTANGEIYRKRRFSAAHLTLPLGCWVEITSRATGNKIRLRVNDRGPYGNKFVVDLSRSAARALGVDVAKDRMVLIRIIALPGEEPLPPDVLAGPRGMVVEEGAVR